jgi:hypothetical protein
MAAPRHLTWQWLLGGLLVLMMLGFAALQSRPAARASYDPAGSDGQGLRALVLWLEAMGYEVDARTPAAFTLGGPPEDATNLLFIFSAGFPLNEEEAAQVRRWVEAGGTLVLAGAGYDEWALADAFDMTQEVGLELSNTTRQGQPLAPDLPASWNQFLPVRRMTLQGAPAAVPVLVDEHGNVLVAVQPVGQGVAWHFADDFDFTNAALRDPNLAGLLPAVLRTVPAGGRVRLHTFLAQSAETDATAYPSVRAWLYGSPLGWGILFSAGALLVFLLLQGWRLGPPLVAPAANRPREAAEYVVALAGLQQRAHQRAAVARYHQQRLKQTVGRPLHLSAELADADFVARLRAAGVLSPDQAETLAALLRDYEQPEDEAQLVRLVQATDAYLTSIGRLRSSQLPVVSCREK